MASEKILNQKKEEVTKLANKIKEAKLVLLTDYRGINVEDVTNLRAELRKANSEYTVIKNNITKRALAEAGIEGLEDKLVGPTAVIMSNEDYLEPAKAIYEFMQEQEIENKINIKINELEDKGMLDLANEYIASYKIILDILDEMVLIFGKEKISMDKYVQILRTGLKNSELGKIPGTQDQVIIGDVERSRSHKVDVIFIIGLNDGSFPSINKAEGFFGDKDREQLKNDGIELAGGTLDNLYEENFNIYKTFTTAEKKLYLSYSSSETEGKSLRPSMMIHKIKNIFHVS